jgi:hypothetical protein
MIEFLCLAWPGLTGTGSGTETAHNIHTATYLDFGAIGAENISPRGGFEHHLFLQRVRGARLGIHLRALGLMLMMMLMRMMHARWWWYQQYIRYTIKLWELRIICG